MIDESYTFRNIRLFLVYFLFSDVKAAAGENYRLSVTFDMKEITDDRQSMGGGLADSSQKFTYH